MESCHKLFEEGRVSCESTPRATRAHSVVGLVYEISTEFYEEHTGRTPHLRQRNLYTHMVQPPGTCSQEQYAAFTVIPTQATSLYTSPHDHKCQSSKQRIQQNTFHADLDSRRSEWETAEPTRTCFSASAPRICAHLLRCRSENTASNGAATKASAYAGRGDTHKLNTDAATVANLAHNPMTFHNLCHETIFKGELQDLASVEDVPGRGCTALNALATSRFLFELRAA